MLHESVQRWQDCPIHIPKSRIIRRGQIIPYIGYVRWRCEICKNYPSRTLNNSAPRFCIWTLPSWKVILLENGKGCRGARLREGSTADSKAWCLFWRGYVYRESMSGYRKERIRVIEVPLPLPKPEKVWRSAFKSMNVYCQKGNETDFKKFSSSFPKLDSMPQDERTLTTSVHCELTLLLYSITSSVYCVKIGISKHCCWLCEKYIEAFQALYKKRKRNSEWQVFRERFTQDGRYRPKAHLRSRPAWKICLSMS